MKNSAYISLRCFSYFSRKDNRYYAFCLELNLADQGTSVKEVQQKLQENIRLYLESELAHNREHNIKDFPFRRSPLGVYLRYYYISMMDRIRGSYDTFKCLFDLENHTLNLCRA